MTKPTMLQIAIVALAGAIGAIAGAPIEAIDQYGDTKAPK